MTLVIVIIDEFKEKREKEKKKEWEIIVKVAEFSGELCEIGSTDCQVQGCSTNERCISSFVNFIYTQQNFS